MPVWTSWRKSGTPTKKTPAIVEFVDIAGLVKGASKGEGLGNKFLGNIRECDAIVHVVRCFDGTDVIHVEGSVDPIRDIQTIDTELILSDLEVVENRQARMAKAAKTGDKKAGAAAQWLAELAAHLGRAKMPAPLSSMRPMRTRWPRRRKWACSPQSRLSTPPT